MQRNRKKMLWIWSSLVKSLSGQTKPSVSPSLSAWAKQDGSACQRKLPCLYFHCIRDIHALRIWGRHRKSQDVVWWKKNLQCKNIHCPADTLRNYQMKVLGTFAIRCGPITWQSFIKGMQIYIKNAIYTDSYSNVPLLFSLGIYLLIIHCLCSTLYFKMTSLQCNYTNK